MRKIQQAIQFDKEVLEAIQQKADQEGRSVSGTVNWICRQYFAVPKYVQMDRAEKER